ncbi:lichenicidin A2 family type 2 lantibiotic [Marinilactibacillus sp. Marseille-P9653]|uniref:lichenicidin A2 family type 2 lantibiotic n=1 Tax=Marinilactibacillus sp. Marseille-P9653 TaxID=2866583 RepID=UPI001CE4A140|nr:lichenicidin A2 family type 2 lantibiotic [Marinilactibacillus sp. Marseille-P9653]
MNKDDKTYIGPSFHELNEAEMAEIVGGEIVETNAIVVSPIATFVSKYVSAVSAKACVSAVSGLISYRHC